MTAIGNLTEKMKNAVPDSGAMGAMSAILLAFGADHKERINASPPKIATTYAARAGEFGRWERTGRE
jgi:hypothetical protein